MFRNKMTPQFIDSELDQVPQNDVNPQLKSYLMEKMAGEPNVSPPEPIEVKQEDPFSDSAREAVKSEMQNKQNSTGMKFAEFFSGLGDALGKRGDTTSDYFRNKRNQIADQTLGDFDKRKTLNRQDAVDKRTKVKEGREDQQYDSNSNESKAMRQIIKSLHPQIAESYGPDFDKLTAADSQHIFKPIEAKARMDERDRMHEMMGLSRRDAVQAKAAEREDARAYKEKELTPARSKQMGLYNSGVQAEQQFLDAVSDKSNYDPTAVGQIIDNSDWAPNFLKNDKAIESKAAQSAWTESFLRDASGAAIADSERGSYIKMFFPQPGDPSDVVKNKKALRDEKMRSAGLGAGLGQDAALPAINSTAKKGKAPGKPKTIVQNGHTYTLNPQTGEYE